MWRTTARARALLLGTQVGCVGADSPLPECSDEPQELVSGQVDDLSHDPIVLEGAEVAEWGCGRPVEADGRGEFELPLVRPGTPVITASYPDFVPTIVGVAEVDLPRGIEVSMYTRADELEFSIEDFGVPYDPDYGGFLVHFFTGPDAAASAVTAGARADIDLPYGTVWGLGPDDEHVPTNVVPPQASSAEIWFHTVTPGAATLSFEPPPGAVCTGPAELPVQADTYTHANVYCEPAPD
jgi:hypothetical protein